SRIKGGDLGPIGLVESIRMGVNRGDGGLELIRTHMLQAKRGFDEMESLLHLLTIPERAILFFQRDQLTRGVDSGVAPGVVKEHEREQSEGFRVPGNQATECAAEANRLRAEFLADQGVTGGGGGAPIEKKG